MIKNYVIGFDLSIINTDWEDYSYEKGVGNKPISTPKSAIQFK